MSDPAAPAQGDDRPSPFPDPRRAGPLDSDVAVSLLQRGQALAEQGDWELAAGTFARVVGNADPALHTAALLGLAECRYRLDQVVVALQAWISATQAPENELSWRAWKALAVARVRSNDNAGAARAYREAARRAPASEQPELQSRIGWLSKESGDERAARRAFSRSRVGGAPQPVATYSIIAVTSAIAVAMFLLGQYDFWFNLLALDKVAIQANHEYWRLLTPVLIHGSFIHLAFNMYALWIIGPLVEALYGPVRFVGLYLLCAAAGSAASYMFSNAQYSVGASGAIFGLFGVLLVADRIYKPILTRHARNLTATIGILIAINLFIGIAIPNIDNAAHVGGLIAGAWLGFVVVPTGATRAASFGREPASVPGLSPPPTSADPPSRRPLLLSWAGVAAIVVTVVIMVGIGPVRLM